MQLSLQQWNSILETSYLTQLLAVVMRNYESLGPIPESLRIRVWHQLKFQSQSHSEESQNVNHLFKRCIQRLETVYHLQLTSTTRDDFMLLFHFLYSILNEDINGLTIKFSDIVEWLFVFIKNQELPVCVTQNRFKHKIVEMFIRECLDTTFIKLLATTPALFINLLDSIFLFGSTILKRFISSLCTEFETEFDNQANLLEIDSDGQLEGMDDVIASTYLPDIRRKIFQEISSTITVGKVDVTRFNAIIFKLQSQLVREFNVEQREQSSEQSFQCTLDEISKTQPIQAEPSPLSRSRSYFNRVIKKSFCDKKLNSSRTPQQKQTPKPEISNDDYKEQLKNKITLIQQFMQNQNSEVKALLNDQNVLPYQIKELKSSYYDLQEFCNSLIHRIDGKLIKPQKKANKQTKPTLKKTLHS